MVERVGIGQILLDRFRMPRSGERKRKPEYSLSEVERNSLEKECGEILEKEDFGREDFGSFCKNMISLVRQEGDPNRYVKLRDRKAELNIAINEEGISIHGDLVATDVPHVFDAGYSQDIFYSPQKKDYGLFLNEVPLDFQPILTTHSLVQVPNSIEYFSYLKGKSESAFPKGTHLVTRQEKVSDKDVQAFCERVYGVYVADKSGLNLPPPH